MANFFIPKSVFKGVNADGTKFTLNEWDYGSLGNMGGFGGLLGIIFIIIFTSLVAPLMLILSIFSYRGRFQITSVIGLLVGLYYLYDSSHFWIASNFNSFIFGDVFVGFTVAITAASIVCHIILLLTTLLCGDIFTSDTSNTSPTTILFIGLLLAFAITYKIVKTDVKGKIYNEFDYQDANTVEEDVDEHDARFDRENPNEFNDRR